MQYKFELNKLPPELRRQIGSHLPSDKLKGIYRLDTGNRFLFKTINNTRDFLECVVRGEHDKIPGMLKANPHFLYTQGKVTDYSGRAFENISGFEYALWALDEHMWTMMFDCIPEGEEKQRIALKLLGQYANVRMNGITYELDGKTITESHYDFKIIEALQTQVDLQKVDGDKDWDSIDKQWREGVGGAQKRLPMHIVYEYCSDVSFRPKPNFESQPKSSMQFYNLIDAKCENWFDGDSKLGSDFAIYKGRRPPARGMGALRLLVGKSGWDGTVDLDAIKALYEARTEAFTNLKLQLEVEVAKDNQFKGIKI